MICFSPVGYDLYTDLSSVSPSSEQTPAHGDSHR